MMTSTKPEVHSVQQCCYRTETHKKLMKFSSVVSDIRDQIDKQINECITIFHKENTYVTLPDNCNINGASK